MEYPLGKVVYETAGWVSHPRVPLTASWYAFIDHPLARDDAGSIATVDQAGNKKTLSEGSSARRGSG